MTAESPGDATRVDGALALCAEFSSPYPHASNDLCRFLSPNQNPQVFKLAEVSPFFFFLRPNRSASPVTRTGKLISSHTPSLSNTCCAKSRSSMERGRGGVRGDGEILFGVTRFFCFVFFSPTMPFVFFLTMMRLFD